MKNRAASCDLRPSAPGRPIASIASDASSRRALPGGSPRGGGADVVTVPPMFRTSPSRKYAIACARPAGSATSAGGSLATPTANMVAPTPVSALLHAVAVVKVGVFSTVRVMLYVFGVDRMEALNLGLPTAYFVSFTILVASVIALSKDNLKLRLAYSTVSQLSYIILGVALLTPTAIEGGLIHITNHAFSKITLFFCAGAIYVASHKKNISEMSGLGRTMPFTFAAFGIASLSMIGAPPVAGFVTKWKLLVGTMEMEHYYIGILLVLLASTLLNVGYFAPVTYKAFFGKRPKGEKYEGIKEAPLSMVIPIMVAAIISVLIGIFPGFMMKFVDLVTPDNVAVAMPQYNPAGAPPFIPATGGHETPAVEHGAPAVEHGVPEADHGKPPAGH